MKHRRVIAILAVIFMILGDIPAFAYTMAPEYLCELGVKYYNEGRIVDAVLELKKALIANPNYEPARRYLDIIQKRLAVLPEAQKDTDLQISSVESKISNIYRNLDRIYAILEKIDKKVSAQGGTPAEKPLVIQQFSQEIKSPEMVCVLERIASSLEKIEKKMSGPAPVEAQETTMKAPPELMNTLERVIAALDKMDKKFALEDEVVSLKAKLDELKALSQIKTSEISGVLDNVLKAIEKIEKRVALLEGFEEARQKVAVQPPKVITEKKPVEEFAAVPEKEAVAPKAGPPEKPVKKPAPVITEKVPSPVGKRPSEKITPASIINLYENFSSLKFPLEIEQGKSLIIKGHTISRFLATEPNIISIERRGSDEITVTGKGLGPTYLHVWDDKGRWTLELQGIPRKPEGLTVAEEMRMQEERAGTFKFTYDLEWDSYEGGSNFDTLKRQSYYWTHDFSLRGETPYGDFNSYASYYTNPAKSGFTSYTVSLTEGRVLNFKDFALKVFDVTPAISNLAYGGNSLRGVTFESPAFNKRVYYTLFWGRDNGGIYGIVSPGLTTQRDSFLEGVDVRYFPQKDLDYRFSLIRGYGRDRPDYLSDYSYYGNVNWRLGDWHMGFEEGYDTRKTASLLKGNYSKKSVFFSYELRDISKDYLSATGQGWRNGELGALLDFKLVPNDRWTIDNLLDIYQDRLFPSPENPNRWNEDYNFNSTYRIDPVTNLNLNYVFQNDLGKLSQTRYQSVGTNLSRLFDFKIRKVSMYTNYRHSQSQNYSNPASNSINDSITNGLRFRLLGELYYYLNKQWNWLDEQAISKLYLAQSLETGLDINTRIAKSKFYNNSRLVYRTEENNGSTLGFLSGEDYIEGYSEINYKPDKDKEVYCSGRLRKVWPSDPGSSDRLEAEFTAGMRYVWDTGLRWEAASTIEGYVFKDLNSDGLRQRDEAPAEGIKVWIGKKSVVTDLFGYYKFTNIKGRKAFVNLDVSTLPAGFVPTVPTTQEVVLAQSRKQKVDFGIVTRSEISGVVFYDANDDGQFSPGDKGIKGVAMSLEDGKKVFTDSNGRYVFSNAPVGAHTVSLDLSSIPVNYIPKVPLTKKVNIFEGVTFVFNVPLKKTQ